MDTASRLAHLRRAQRYARLLDTWFRIPGTRIRLGLDSLGGLIPGIGDAAGLVAAFIVYHEANLAGVSKPVLTRMLGNIAVDAAIGLVPVVGDLADIAFKANRRNVDLMREDLERQGLYPGEQPRDLRRR